MSWQEVNGQLRVELVREDTRLVRMMHESSVTWNTVGAVVSHASQTMHPGTIQTFVTTGWVAMNATPYGPSH